MITAKNFLELKKAMSSQLEKAQSANQVKLTQNNKSLLVNTFYGSFKLK